jgi:hypothetical protein
MDKVLSRKALPRASRGRPKGRGAYGYSGQDMKGEVLMQATARQISMMPGIPVTGRSMADLAEAMKEAVGAGVLMTSIAEVTGVARPSISGLVNHGGASLNPERQEKLWSWYDDWKASRAGALEDAMPGVPGGEFKQGLSIFPTADFTEAIGWCGYISEHNKIGVLIGMPGTGKTTIAKRLVEILPRAIYIEAWQSMKMGDMLEEIGSKLGLMLKGSLTKKTRDIMAALTGSNVTLIVDEAEYLKKWNIEKLDVLRKIHDNTGIALILIGTPAFRNVLNKSDATQLSRRMFVLDLRGCTKAEVRRELNAYNIEPEAADVLAAIASDTDHGGMGSYALMMELCLDAAVGGRITMAMLQEARQYKPGLRKQ